MSAASAAAQPGGLRAWFVWSLAALAFGYAFFHRVAPSVMVSDLQSEFAIGATVLGTLSALYFYPYVLMQIPLGVMIDRWGARLLLTLALSIAALGSMLFAVSPSIEFAYFGRLLIGIGSAVGFLGSLALAAKWFPPHRFAFFAGLTMLIAMMSGISAQGPLAAFVDSYGWRNALWGLAVFGLVLATAIFLFVRNTPQSGLEKKADIHAKAPSIRQGFKRAASDWSVWKVALVASTMSGPMLTIGALWGTPYLVAAYNLDKTTAASLTSFLLLGWAFGAPFGGWLSDRIRMRKGLIAAGAFVLTVAVGAVTFIPGLPLFFTVALFAIMGVSGAFMAICFALVREISPADIASSVTGIVNSLTVASGALLQPAVGVVLDQMWEGARAADGAPIYLAEDFQTAFILVFVSSLVGLLIAVSMKETPVWSETGIEEVSDS